MTFREDVLDKAKAIITGDREDDYGGPEDSFKTIATLWNAYFDASGRDISIEPYEVALILDLLKTARLIGSNGKHLDSWTDKSGYAGCGAEVAIKPSAERGLIFRHGTK